MQLTDTRLAATFVLVCLVEATSVAFAGGLKVVVFDVEPIQIPQSQQMDAKIQAETALLRKIIADRGMTVVDTKPQAAKIADNLPLSQCNGCDQDIAKALGADIAIATAMQAVSASTFLLSGSVKDVETDRVLRQGVIDIRGENADVWDHGMKFLIKERLLAPPLPTDAKALAAAVDEARRR